MATVEDLLEQHQKHDDERFDSMGKKLDAIHEDVRSLILTREYQRGIMRAAMWTAGTVSATITVLIGIAKTIHEWWVIKP